MAINEKADPKVGPAGIGTAGFEPATPATPLQCATGLRYVPLMRGGSLAVDLRRGKGRGRPVSANAFHDRPMRLSSSAGVPGPPGRRPVTRPTSALPASFRYLGGHGPGGREVGPGICA